MTTSPALFTTTLAPHTWQRPGASCARPLSKAKSILTRNIIRIFIGIVKINHKLRITLTGTESQERVKYYLFLTAPDLCASR
jgi:hypothetical protein